MPPKQRGLPSEEIFNNFVYFSLWGANGATTRTQITYCTIVFIFSPLCNTSRQQLNNLLKQALDSLYKWLVWPELFSKSRRIATNCLSPYTSWYDTQWAKIWKKCKLGKPHSQLFQACTDKKKMSHTFDYEFMKYSPQTTIFHWN